MCIHIRVTVYYRYAFVINIIARLFNFPYERISHQSPSYSVFISLMWWRGEASFVKISLSTVFSLLYAQGRATLRSERPHGQLQGRTSFHQESINFSMWRKPSEWLSREATLCRHSVPACHLPLPLIQR